MEVKNIIDPTKKYVVISAVLFSLLLISCINTHIVFAANAAEIDYEIKTLDILTNVVGLNTTEYTLTLNSQVDGQYLGLPQKEVDITLLSEDGKLRVNSYFVNNNLRQIYFSNHDGKHSVQYPVTDTVEMAKTFLENYKNCVGDSIYGQLASLLDNVDVTKNITKSDVNIRLNVLNINQNIIEYVWRYTDENGVIARSKNVILSYDKGQLKVFLNNWPLYSVVGTPQISGEKATEIALEASKTFSYNINVENESSTITGFEIAPESLGHEVLSYLNNPNQTLARGGDPFTLYPSWYVPIGFTKSYPGAVTGITATVWADTGEISNTNPMVVSLSSETLTEDNNSSQFVDSEKTADGFTEELFASSGPILISTSFVAVGLALVHEKRLFKVSNKWNLTHGFWVTLLCGLLLFGTVFVTSPTVNAVIDPNSKAEIYAAYYSTPEQHPDEIGAADWVCDQIKQSFQASGYNASDNSGDYTTNGNVTDNAEYDEDNFYRVAVFHFGHQSSPNFAYQDNEGLAITWADLDSHIDSNKHVFVLMWVCQQARGPDYGIPANWTNKNTMNPDGYSSPDGGGQCYIGFDGFSPMISITNGTSFETQTTGAVKYFIQTFYDYALTESYSVKDALNQATLNFFGDTFPSSILGDGYGAWYCGDENHNATYYDGQMRVFGDGNIVLFQPSLSISVSGSGGYTNPSGFHRFTYGYNALVYAHAYTNYVFSHWNLDGEYYSSNALAQVPMYDNHNLQAFFSYVPPTYTLSISAGAGGTTSPSPGTHYYSSGTPVQVTAYPNANYDFDHWSLDGNTYYSNPITVTMNTNHNLQAYFTYSPPPTYPLTVYAYANGGPIYVPFYLDGGYVGTTMSTYYVTAGTHSVAVPGELPPYLVFDYWVGVSGGTVNVQGSTSIYAYYHFLGK